MIVSMICAVGNYGQIGMDDGRLPWPRQHLDLAWFWQTIEGRPVIVGHQTVVGMSQHYPAAAQRLGHACTACVWRGPQVHGSAERFLRESVLPMAPDEVFVIGGARTFKAFMPHASRFLISRIDYDGDADVYFPGALPWEAP